MKAGATKSVVVAVQPSTSRAPARAQRRTRARPRRRRRRTCGEKLRRCYKACVSPSCALACLAVVLMLAATVLLVSVVSEGDAATGQVVAGVVCLSLAVFTAVAFVAVTLRRRSQQRMNLVKAQAVVHSLNAVCTICNRSTRSVCDQSHKWVTKQRLQALGKEARAKVKAALAESRAVPGFSRSVCPVGAGLCGAFVDATCGASNCPPRPHMYIVLPCFRLPRLQGTGSTCTVSPRKFAPAKQAAQPVQDPGVCGFGSTGPKIDCTPKLFVRRCSPKCTCAGSSPRAVIADRVLLRAMTENTTRTMKPRRGCSYAKRSGAEQSLPVTAQLELRLSLTRLTRQQLLPHVLRLLCPQS